MLDAIASISIFAFPITLRMRFFLYTLFCFVNFLALSQDTTSVLFGQHSDSLRTEKSNLLRVFMDKNGDYYPENSINEEDLRNQGQSELIKWAEAFPNKFQTIAKDYHISCEEFSPVLFAQLQDSIILRNSRMVNERLAGRSVTVLVHGFRKKAYGKRVGRGTYSTLDNAFGRSKVNLNTFFIEIYWDGHYRQRPANARQLLALGEMFKSDAVPNAENTGYGLRRLLNTIDCQELNFISHSTGTHVATSLLFNKTDKASAPTPSQAKVNVIVLASASSGKKHFKNYYNRTTAIDFRSKDNYHLFIIYNKADFVLKKKGFARIKGNTTLGCNHQGEAKRLKRYFSRKFKNSSIDLKQTSKVKNHTFSFYVKSNSFAEVIDFIRTN